MKAKHTSFLLLLVVFFAALFLHGCWFSNSGAVGGGGDRVKPPQTKILKVLVQPDTIAPGDTARFICIIKDSTDKRFKFEWHVDKGKVLGAEFIDTDYSAYVSETNSIKWIAPDSEGYYHFAVFVNNGAKDSLSVQDGFFIKVN
jgi:hypothetical protein